MIDDSLMELQTSEALMIVLRILYPQEDLSYCDVSYHKNMAVVTVGGGLNLKVSEMS